MDFLSPEEFAAQLSGRGHKVSAYWVREELKAGRVRGSKIRRRWFVPEDALDELVKTTSNQAAPTRRRRKRAS